MGRVSVFRPAIFLTESSEKKDACPLPLMSLPLSLRINYFSRRVYHAYTLEGVGKAREIFNYMRLVLKELQLYKETFQVTLAVAEEVKRTECVGLFELPSSGCHKSD